MSFKCVSTDKRDGFFVFFYDGQIGYGTTENSPVTFLASPMDNMERKAETVGYVMEHVEVRLPVSSNRKHVRRAGMCFKTVPVCRPCVSIQNRYLTKQLGLISELPQSLEMFAAAHSVLEF